MIINATAIARMKEAYAQEFTRAHGPAIWIAVEDSKPLVGGTHEVRIQLPPYPLWLRWWAFTRKLRVVLRVLWSGK